MIEDEIPGDPSPGLLAVADAQEQEVLMVLVEPRGLERMVGPDAAQAWQARYDAGKFDRLNAVVRFLLAAVRIGECKAARFRLDFDRVSIERNELPA